MIRTIWILGALAFSGCVAAAETVTYIHSDPNGSPYLATNAAGAISWQEVYRPFGDRLTREADPFGNQVWFAGQPEAIPTEVSRMGVRHYNPEIGRFYGVDPVAFDPTQPQTINPYQYANNNPYRFVDADGRNAVTAFGGVLNESWSFLNGEGFNYERIGGALADGYDGEGDGVIAAATEDALFFIGGPASSLATKGAIRLYQGWRASTVARAAVTAGRAGETAVRGAYAIGPATRIVVNGRSRIPDGLTRTVLSEVKNVDRLGLTRQLRDYLDFARNTGRRFDLYVRPTARLSGPLQQAIEDGLIILREIPF